jgi:hypothetical protein
MVIDLCRSADRSATLDWKRLIEAQREPMYPQSYEYLQAELRGDKDKLRSLWYSAELQRLRDRREQGGST